MILYYVHHHGSGHAHRAASVAARCRSVVVGAGSGPAPARWPGEWVTLPPDTDDALESRGTERASRDVTAHGTLHWVPRHHDGLRDRMAVLSSLLSGRAVRAVVCDVSVEVALLARLHGVPVAVMAQPGRRLDRPHRTAYDLADVLLAPWPRHPARAGWPAAWRRRTVHLGGLSRFDGRAPAAPPGQRRVLVLTGSGGAGVDLGRTAAAAAATPDWTWRIAGPATGERAGPPNLVAGGWSGDVWSELQGADVVVGHAGQNVVAEIAAARRPAVIVPERRPFGEQSATAAVLARAGLATVLPRWPSPEAWPSVLAEAVAAGGRRWAGWSDGTAADRAADAIDELAGA